MRPPVARREFLAAAGGALVAAASSLSGCAPREPLAIALSTWPGYEFLRLAAELGWIPAGTVELRRTAAFAESVDAFRRGAVGAAGVTLDEVLKLRDAGVPAQVALIFNVSMGADVLLARPGLDSLAALRGARIGMEPITLGELLLARALAEGGLTRADVQVVPMAGDAVDAWRGGGLDAVLTYEPAAGRLRRLGLVPLYDSRRLPQLIVDVLAIHRDAGARHAAALRAAIAAHFRALGRWRTNPIDTSYRLGAQLHVEPERVADLYRGLDLPDALYNREYLTAPAREMTRATLELARFLEADGVLRGRPRVEDLFVPDFLPGGAA